MRCGGVALPYLVCTLGRTQSIPFASSNNPGKKKTLIPKHWPAMACCGKRGPCRSPGVSRCGCALSADDQPDDAGALQGHKASQANEVYFKVLRALRVRLSQIK